MWDRIRSPTRNGWGVQSSTLDAPKALQRFDAGVPKENSSSTRTLFRAWLLNHQQRNRRGEFAISLAIRELH